MDLREAFSVVRTSSKLPSLKSALRSRICSEMPARRICRRSWRAARAGVEAGASVSRAGSDMYFLLTWRVLEASPWRPPNFRHQLIWLFEGPPYNKAATQEARKV